MAFIIDTINGSGLYAQSAASASVATYDSNGNVITATYLTAHQPISANEWNSVYETVGTNSGSWTGSETSPTASVDSNGSIDIVSSNNTVYFDVNGTWFNDAVNSAVDVPTGVMVESACEYNAVNEISGYNGSAIAQYGAEKQWLQHDDTIVHVANSAQYALGVNVSAVQALMGMMGPKLNEETFAGYWNGYPEYQYLQEFHFNSNVGGASSLPDQIKRASAVEGCRHIDLSNSYIVYGHSWITLPLQWNLGNTRAGGFMIYDDGIYYRGYDSAPSDCTAYICYRYRKL